MPSQTPFDDLMTDEEYNAARGQSPRTSQRERSMRIGPPFIKIGRKIYYRKAAVRDWLLALEQVPVRSKLST